MKSTFSELEAVLAVARHKGFRSAARALGVSSSAISHAVGAFEERLAVRLFNRTTRSVSLTTAGEELVRQVGPALATIESAIDAIAMHASEPNGPLRINMSHGAARLMLQPILLEYARRYPKVQLEVATDDTLIDIVAKGFDAGARLHDAVPPDMVAVPVFRELRMIVVGSPAYLQGRTLPFAPRDLAEHECIQIRLSSGRIYRWEFERHGNTMAMDVPGRIILDSFDLALSAALSGSGLAYVEEKSARDHVDAGRLIQLLDDWTPPFEGLSLYFPGRHNLPPNLRALVDLIRETTGKS